MRVAVLISILSKPSKDRLRKYLSVFEEKQDIIALYEYLVQNINTEHTLTNERVFFELYNPPLTNEKDRKDFSSYCNRLTIHIKNFIAHERMTNKRNKDFQYNRDIIVLEEIGNKLNSNTIDEQLQDQLYKIYSNILRRSISAAKKAKYDIFYYARLWRLYHLSYFNLITPKPSVENFGELLEYSQKFYCLILLRYSIEKLLRKQVADEKIDFELPEKVKSQAEQFAETGDSLFKIYLQHFHLLQSFDKEKFTTVNEIVKENFDEIKKGEIANMLALSSNHVARESRKNEGNINIYQEIFKIYNFAFENDVWIVTGKLDVILMLNYASLCLETKNLDKLKSGLKTYIKKIDKNFSIDTKNICQAYLHFGKREFKKALEVLELDKYERKVFYLHYWTLKIRTLYEMKDKQSMADKLIAECEAYRDSLDRHKTKKDITERVHESNRNFAYFTKLLYRKSTGKSSLSKQEIEDYFGNKNMVHKNWIKQKINELHNS